MTRARPASLSLLRCAVRLAPVALLGLAAFGLAGCGSNDGVGPQLSAAEGIAFGWEAFEAGNLSRAESFFLAAVRANGRSAEANAGLGWTRAYEGDLALAAASLEKAATLDPGSADARAGLAAVWLASGEREKAIERASEALALDARWSFAHRSGVNAEDLHLILAQAHALEGPAGNAPAQVEVDFLEPQNGLDPNDAATWTVGSRRFGTYREALLATIEDLERRIGAALP